jgi:hypothetical protein
MKPIPIIGHMLSAAFALTDEQNNKVDNNSNNTLLPMSDYYLKPIFKPLALKRGKREKNLFSCSIRRQENTRNSLLTHLMRIIQEIIISLCNL